MKRYREGGRQTEFETERELTFLHHSLQDVHVIFLSHSAERWQLGLGNELQQLERERERENRHKYQQAYCQTHRLSVPPLLTVCYTSLSLRH